MSDSLEPHPDVFARRIGEEVLLVHLGSNEIFSLNSTAGRLWELVSQGDSLTAAAARLSGEHDVDEVQLRAEIETLVRRVTEEGLLRQKR